MFCFKNDLTAQLPFNPKKLKKKTRYFDYYVFQLDNQIVLRKRTAKDIWQNLYDFPCQESDKKQGIIETLELQEVFGESLKIEPEKRLEISKFNKQALSHQWIISRFIHYKLKNLSIDNDSDYILVNISDFGHYAFPKTVDLYLKENSITLYNKD